MNPMINEDLKEMLSYPETLSLVCYNINCARRYEPVTISKLSYLLGIEEERLEKACRILPRIGMARVFYRSGTLMVEMIDPDDAIVKNTIFDVMWEKRYDFSMIYKEMVMGELTYKASGN